MKVPRSAAVAATFVLLVAFGCDSFGEGQAPATASDGAPPIDDAAAATGDVPPDEAVVPREAGTGSKSAFCIAKRTGTSVVFCSDFDDITDDWAGWDRPDTAAGAYALDTSVVHSPARSALLTIKGPVGTSPDARLRLYLDSANHFVVSGFVWVDTPNETDAIILRMQLDDGSIFVRSSGLVMETIKSENTSTNVVHLPKFPAPIPLKRWLEVVFDLDLPSGNFSVSADGNRRDGQMRTKHPSGARATLIVGAFDPYKTVAPDLKLRLDDVVVTAD